MSQLIETVIDIASDEIGVIEHGGNNRGKRVEEYLAAAALPPGNPWCAAFVAWVLKKAGIPIDPKKGWPLTGYCPHVETWAKQRGILYTAPARGDAFLLYDAEGPFHIGFVEKVRTDGFVDTIEGNTNDGGSADGDGVYRRRRAIGQCRFVRWATVVNASDLPKPKVFMRPDKTVTVVIPPGGLPEGNYHVTIQA